MRILSPDQHWVGEKTVKKISAAPIKHRHSLSNFDNTLSPAIIIASYSSPKGAMAAPVVSTLVVLFLLAAVVSAVHAQSGESALRLDAPLTPRKQQGATVHHP